MNIVRIGILAVALIAAALTALLVSSLVSTPPEVTESAPDPTTQVLVAAKDIEVGSKIAAADLRWQVWPKDAINSAYFTMERNPNAIEEQTGGVVRTQLFANGPITPGKILKSGDAGFMSAILEGGMRAYTVKASPDLGAGGFILPGDRVDVIHAKQVDTSAAEAPTTGVSELNSKTIVENVRVLAIDQTVSDPKEGKATSSIVGKTVTLEVSPQQAEIIANAEVQGTMSLSLRSLERRDDGTFADREAKAAAELAATRSKSDGFNLIRFGLPFKYRPQ